MHRNTSDLTQQSYSTTFDGGEFFLRDHRVNGQKVLPGVAYLEMVRAAIRAALPAQEEASIELRNVIWAQPIVVTERTEVTVALFPAETPAGSGQTGGHIEYEVYSVQTDADGVAREIVHSQGLAVIAGQPAPDQLAKLAQLDIGQLRSQMTHGRWEAPQIYAAYDKMGIHYGPTHKGVTAILRGERQLLARLCLPSEAADAFADYLLHPSLMDAAVQSAVGFIEDSGKIPDRPNLPFALQSLRILSACTKEMFAWLRFSAGSKPGDKVIKLDIDLCDPEGRVCVQMQGFTSRVLDKENEAETASGTPAGTLYAAPTWEAAKLDIASETTPRRYDQRHIILCGPSSAHAAALEAAIADSACLPLPAAPGRHAAERYQEAATACFERIKNVLANKPGGPVLVQVVVADSDEDALLLGLAGLLKTAALENPLLTGQIVVAGAQAAAEELARQLQAELHRPRDTVVRYAQGAREVLTWRELDAGQGGIEDQAENNAPMVFKDKGVYLITGGLGGLGVLFAKEILKQARGAKVILTGRSELTPDRKALLKSLSSRKGAVEYRRVDIADAGQVRQLVAAIVKEHKQIDGILHSAGMIRDSFILKKTAEEFRQVLEPKVAGTFNLDEACKHLDLDFMVLFSAGAAVTGNGGQADYAAANGFMDRFALYRNQLVAAGRRKGKTRAINWPLWQEGGMGVDAATQEQMLRAAGLIPMRTATGMQAFRRSLALPHAQIQVVEGDLSRLRATLFADEAPEASGAAAEPAHQAEPVAAAGIDSGDLEEKTRNFLKKRLSSLLKLPANKIDAAAPFEKYGINSIMTMNLTNELEKTFGSLPKTLFFEYQTLAELAQYFVKSHAAQLAALFAEAADRRTGSRAAPAEPAVPKAASPATPATSRASRRRRFAVAASAIEPARTGAVRSTEPIAVVGLSGRYPGARDIEEYWRNLRDGKDCIVEVPQDRWDWREYFTDDRSKSGRHYSKWGGFIDGVDEFDALFFNIPPVDAERIDPQERLFLQHAWMALEDAGYTRASLQIPREQDQAGQAGVYVGVMYGEYQLFGAETSLLGERMVTPSSYSSIANRVSYFLNLHGPSMAVDTMCSSSLTAIHLACQDLRLGRTDVAIAGGVNVTIHPNKYLLLSSGQFIASDGRCQSFGEGGDGYIPAEGVGAVILKRLSEAERDGNHIYGVIKASALNHGGKTNGYSVPNPQSQASVIGQAFKECGVDPRHVSYVEAHGTGTKLGDPIEIAALTQVFRQHTQENRFCLIGSAKSNIGHAESAAGIAGLTKVLLQLKHRQIVPSLHSSALNPHIDFDKTPFVVNQTLREWEQPEVDGRRLPRIAGLSSFGAGGSNAHLIVEEYAPSDRTATAGFEGAQAPAAIVLSARTPEQLKQKIRDLHAFLRAQEHAVDLHSMAYTLQVGREAMQERFGLIVDSVEQLTERLQACLDGDEQVEDSYQGQARRDDEALSLFSSDADLRETIEKWIAGRKLSRLLELWTKGLELDWNKLYGEAKPRFVSLPTYPFARDRCWIDRVKAVGGQAVPGTAGAVLHPLLHANTSDFSQQSYRSTFTGSEFFLADHRVGIGAAPERKVLPGVAYLEMARAAVEQALPAMSGATTMELRNIVWAQPLVVDDRRQVDIALAPNDDGRIDFEIRSQDGEEGIVHCQGQAVLGARPASSPLDIERLQARMQRGALEPDSIYAAYARMGLRYGPAHRAIAALALGERELLAHLRLPPAVEASRSGYQLHPSLLDGALQAAIGLAGAAADASTRARLPFALDTLHIVAPCTTEMLAWVRYAPGSEPDDNVVKLDIDLCDSQGKVCVQMRGFSSRMLGKDSSEESGEENGKAAASERTTGSLVAAPVWQAAAASGAGRRDHAQRHVILCELPGIDTARIEASMPGSRCLRLQAPPASTLAERYTQHALACFEHVRAILEGKPQDQVLVQIVVADGEEGAVLAGLSGLLRTAALENPRLVGQLILVAPDIGTEPLARQLQEDGNAPDAVVRHTGERQVLHWQELPADPGTAHVAFKDHGVYLITGGLGGLGMLFAKEILAQASRARVILTGRSAPSADKQAALDQVAAQFGATGGRLAYRTLDLDNADEVKRFIAATRKEYGRIDGILHSAGMTADNFILKKSAEEFGRVLAPKVAGTFHLDQATQDAGLDFFVLFSSTSSAMGNAGQADYAAANGFMDQFAAYRNRLAAAGQRQGRTLSINWPLWQEGGMRIDPETLELLRQATGVQPMQTTTGMQALYRSLGSEHGQTLVLEGELTGLRAQLRRAAAEQTRPRESAAMRASAPVATTMPAPIAAATPAGDLLDKAEDYLRKQFSEVLKVPSHKVDPQAPLENYGIDSVVAMKLTNVLEKTFGSLSKTLFFEYQTIAKLAAYLVKAFPDVVRKEVGLATDLPGGPAPAAETAAVPPATADRLPAVPALRGKNRFLGAPAQAQATREVAIVGLSGRYPQAENLEAFWENLKAGRDCITEIPADRWDHALYFDPDRNRIGKTYAKWGGFLADVDKFDPLFFNISPKEAEVIDPQERLFLETAWETIEDAGYGKDSLSGKRVGVFVGVMWGHYELYGAAALAGKNPAIPTSSHASVANRVSYFFNLHGPSIALDTMCSSSLTAIHLATEEIRRGNIDAALAGGVNLSIHPQKYLNLSQGKFAASDGRCRSFGAGGDGYVPGEGVGAVFLKPLEDALRDGDHVYAVVRSSALNHGGKTNGYTVPNPNAQGELILDALKKAGVDPKTLGYIETHGTGTSLGDPIEITGLQQAFAGYTDEKKICPIGSVKSNIGHLESAAGIAAVTKALLQIKHEQLVPSLHAEPLNPNIDFEASPFYVQTRLADWKRSAEHPEQPRRVAVSSFGAGGSNAHVILEEHIDTRPARAVQPARPEVFVLSARDPGALHRYAARVARFLEHAGGESLTDIAYTSQVGRTPLPARLAVIAASVDELKDKLGRWVASRTATERGLAANGLAEPEDVFQGNVNDAQYNAGNLIQGAAGRAFLQDLLAKRDLAKVAQLWTLGADIDWLLAHHGAQPRRVSLPTYPFAKERYWVDAQAFPAAGMPAAPKAVPKAVEEPRRNYYRPRWKASPLDVSAASQAATGHAGPILLLDTSEEFFQAFKESLAETPVFLAKLGGAYQEVSSDSFTIDPEREEDFNRLVEVLKGRNLLPSLILHRYAQAGGLEQSEQEIVRRLDRGVYALLHASKALMLQKQHAAPKMMSFFTGDSHASAPLGAALAGFYRTLRLENPKYVSKVVEIRAADGEAVSVADEVGIVLDELRDGAWAASEIRYLAADGQTRSRHAREYVSYQPVQSSDRKADLPLKQHGVYLVTGGLGGLGFIVADYLARHFQAKLVLAGRSTPNEEHAKKIERLHAHGAETLHLRADVAKPADVESMVREAKARFGRIDGVIHSAGINRDSFILKKTRDEMAGVLEPKVFGAFNLDRATREEDLDLFVLFSSVAGALGNLGQCDYAYANRFLDAFAEEREALRAAGRRSGRTLSINWPFWEEGGMTLSRDAIAASAKHTGMHPLPSAEGIRYWEDFLRSGEPQGIALYGAPSRIAAYVGHGAVRTGTGSPVPAGAADAATLPARTEAYLKALIGEEIKLAPERIDARERLESFGIDSIMVGRLNERLTRDLGELPKTLFYEYETIEDLAKYFVREAPQVLTELFARENAADGAAVEIVDAEAAETFEAADAAEAIGADLESESVRRGRELNDAEPIAIIGVHGYYPRSKDLNEYWENLRQGKDLVGPVPAERWDAERFYDADPARAAEGKIYCKWGAFLDDFDKFDAAFFNIEPEEARIIDPQERLFLQSVWSAIEDAGYTRESLKRRFPKARSADVGVFVGVTTNSYHLLTADEWNRGNIVSPSALPWSIANRVSYFFDFQGPSMPVDTACSSSSVAIHLACESLRRQECQVAVAGGVNLYLHPSKYHGLCQKRMLAAGGKCRSYGAGDDGFVPGEGVGTLVLKPLSRAKADGDHIHAVIVGSAYDHSGRSNGYSAPNPNSQASLIGQTLSKAGIHPESIGYIEGHGTGTQLGDSLEIVALTQAFGKQTQKRRFCPLGSVKANQGHSESAAGVAGVTKVLLQMKHRQLAPTIHSEEVNPNIAFERSPFYLQHAAGPWEAAPDQPRRALVNSFGAGGVNACVVLEEYVRPAVPAHARAAGPQLIILSAKTEERLREYADRLLDHVRREAGATDVDLAALAYTLQVGREAMPERLALAAADIGELIAKLEAWLRGAAGAGVRRGSLDPRRGARRASKEDKDVLDALLAARDLDGLAQAWIGGAEVDWERLHAHGKPSRMPLPTYPFARERHWISDAPAPASRAETVPGTARLHPLVSHNSSTLKEVSFSSMLSGNAFYARDHKVNGQSIFPGAGFLEIACVSGALAGTKKVGKIRDVVFIAPLLFTGESQMVRISLTPTDDNAEYIITSYDADREKVVHSEGVIEFRDGTKGHGAEETLSIEALKAQCARPVAGEHYYGLFEQSGISYGPSFRTMQELYIGKSFALSKLSIADHLRSDFEEFVLHPSLVDGALQTVSGLVGGVEPPERPVPYLPFAIDEVEIVRPASQTCYVHVEEVELKKQGNAEIKKFNIKILNEKGLVSVSFKNFCVRAFRAVPSSPAARDARTAAAQHP
ncbi:MAG TPA: SDR family NAD(P)-dependent oxidoreductase [Paucimonas sp.]|nr:SDR family NAD(P)-dependent oxidoreductase [Paucimonas sp.]